jgi:hypothetical protein
MPPVRIYSLIKGERGPLILESTARIKAGAVPGIMTVVMPAMQLPLLDEQGNPQEFSVWLVDPLGNEYPYVSMRAVPKA